MLFINRYQKSSAKIVNFRFLILGYLRETIWPATTEHGENVQIKISIKKIFSLAKSFREFKNFKPIKQVILIKQFYT